MRIENWPNVSFTGNTFVGNTDYDYTTAWDTGTFATIKKWVDNDRIQTVTTSGMGAENIANCQIYGNEANPQFECSNLIDLANIMGLNVSGDTQTV